MNQFKYNRDFMKSNFKMLEEISTDQQMNLPQPPLQKPVQPGAELIALPKASAALVKQTDFFTCVKRRRSVRKYIREAITLEELSFLLWATQGVQRVFGDNYATFRPVPSGGARHPFETYIIAQHIAGLKMGVYRYLALSHELVFLFDTDDLAGQLRRISPRQPFVSEGAAVFAWSCLPYRGEWRYHTAAHKCMLIDVGHLCQNLYLACAAIGCGTCAVGDYDQEILDDFLGLNGEDEYVVYIAPVGKI